MARTAPPSPSRPAERSQTQQLLARIFRRRDQPDERRHADSPVRALLRQLSLRRGRSDGPGVLLEGQLKLQGPRGRPAYFVLEQTPRGFTLRQYGIVESRPARLVSVVELSQYDVVSDLSGHALELQFRAEQHTEAVDVGVEARGQQSLRLKAEDEAVHARWLHTLNSCIDKLIVQAETRHRLGSSTEPAKVAPFYGDEGRRSSVYSTGDRGRSASSGSECSNNHCRSDIPVEEIRAARQDSQDEKEEEEAKTAQFEMETQLSQTDTLSNHSQQSSSLVAPVQTSGDEAAYDMNAYCCTPEIRSSESSEHTDPDADNNEASDSDSGNDNQEDDQDNGAEQFAAQCAVAPYKTAKAAKRRSPYQAALAEGEYRKASNGSTTGNGHGRLPRAAFGATTSSSSFFPFMHPHSQTHSFNANGQVFTLDTRYELVKPIGTGAYGAVIAVKDVVNGGENLAVKKITNIFEDLVDAKRILREVRLLHHFNHKNITRLLDLAPPPSRKQFDDMYIITELMETDLHQVIYSMQPMSDDHVKYFLYQMLCALHHIHSAGVLHRDMKPSNILLNANCDLKVCDFGLARGGVNQCSSSGGDRQESVQPGELTEYVVTRWYRAPEIMLNCLHYTTAIDVWAVGCIFAEMLLREPLFPGNDYLHQLKLIIKFLGTPKQEDIGFVKNAKALRFLTKLAISKPKKWRDVFAGSGTVDEVSPEAIDLLNKMLLFNPEKRISVNDALHHPYLATFFDENDLVRSTPFDFSFDLPDDQLSKEALVDLLCEDIEEFHPPIPTSTAATPLSAAASRFFRLGMTASAS